MNILDMAILAGVAVWAFFALRAHHRGQCGGCSSGCNGCCRACAEAKKR